MFSESNSIGRERGEEFAAGLPAEDDPRGGTVTRVAPAVIVTGRMVTALAEAEADSCRLEGRDEGRDEGREEGLEDELDGTPDDARDPGLLLPDALLSVLPARS